jgi:adenylate cyclase
VKSPRTPTLAQVAASAEVSPATVRRWLSMGLVPGYEGTWTPATVAHLHVIARLRARGHTLEQIKRASDNGQLAVGPIEHLLARSEGRYAVDDVAAETGLASSLVQRIFTNVGLSSMLPHGISQEDMEMVRAQASVLAAGFPEPALLQLLRVYGQAVAQIADAEVRLVHLYIHEPLMRDGVSGREIAEDLEVLVRGTLPFASPLMDHLHTRFLAQFVEQDVVGHMEADLAEEAPQEGRLRVAIAFADLAGYSRLTVERGDEEAVGAVERFLAEVQRTLPVDARVIKTLGDEVMVIGSDPVALTEWAVALQAATARGDPKPRIGLHYGAALYRDGDYYGREVNQAARVAARAAGGEVLVTRPVVEMNADPDGLRFERIGEVGLKGFSEPTELFVVSALEG